VNAESRGGSFRAIADAQASVETASGVWIDGAGVQQASNEASKSDIARKDNFFVDIVTSNRTLDQCTWFWCALTVLSSAARDMFIRNQFAALPWSAAARDRVKSPL
jgi:hypothetical protein